MEQDPGNKKFENNKWDILREPEFKDRTEEAPEKKRERTDAEKARIAERVLSAEETAILARDYFERAKAEAPTRAKEYISNMLLLESKLNVRRSVAKAILVAKSSKFGKMIMNQTGSTHMKKCVAAIL